MASTAPFDNDGTRSLSDWKDDKRYFWLFGLLMAPLPLIGGVLAGATGLDVFWYLMPVYVYVIVPLADLVVGEDTSNPPEAAVPTLDNDAYYRRIVYAFLPLQYLVFAWGTWTFVTADLSLVAQIGLVASIGLLGGGAINAAHELGHKPGSREGWLAKIALAQTGYGHFYVEHNRGHHVRVATPDDPASSRYGEGFYRFWARTVTGSIVSAWRLEARRLERAGHGVWHWRNHNLQAWALTVVLFAALAVALGVEVLPFLIVQAVIGFSLLEVVNYVEHYGLKRRRNDKGAYERVKPQHSWNSNHKVSNLMLYHLQRHSDHHANWTRSYQALRHMDGAPQLPAGYSAMIMLALVPPLWRRVMDPRLSTHYDGDLSLANSG